MALLLTIHIGLGMLRPGLDPQAVFLRVTDTHGSYTIPYIQSSPRLEVSVEFKAPNLDKVRLAVMEGQRLVQEGSLSRDKSATHFDDLAPGEYSLKVVGVDVGGKEIGASTYTRIGIGTVIAALGDSITEGYFSHGFMRGDDLDGSQFPPEVVSRDGRNFPQYSPTTSYHLPSVNCFESWMTALNNSLNEALKQPVFIANEGWGGYTTANYLSLMRSDANWQERMRLLKPQVWLIHLGVNDERAKLPAETVGKNLAEIVETLEKSYGAAPGRIVVARPAYDYAEGAKPILEEYCAEIDKLVARMGLVAGPDFFAAYSKDKARLYGDDPVHPNLEGMKLMAQLWHETIVKK